MTWFEKGSYDAVAVDFIGSHSSEIEDLCLMKFSIDML